MGYLERNSETLKTPGFSGFDSRVSGFSRVVIFGFGSGSGSKKVGLFARVSGFRVQIPITSTKYQLFMQLFKMFFQSRFCKYYSPIALIIATVTFFSIKVPARKSMVFDIFIISQYNFLFCLIWKYIFDELLKYRRLTIL